MKTTNSTEVDNTFPANTAHKSVNIFAAQKIIADISSGLYRSPAAALKELITNAYDADATIVKLTTDAPYFRTIVVSDNGTGMTIEDFLHVVQHIGGSRKRYERNTSSKYQRPLIGRIGIGMLAVAQLGFRFFVTSSVKGSPTRFTAEVNLEPFHKDDAALKSMGKVRDNDEIQIGAVQYIDDIPEEEEAHYTVITIPQVKQGIISDLTNSVRKALGVKEELSIKTKKVSSFDEILDVTRIAKRADAELDGYYYLLWELALLCPINYSQRGLFEQGENIRIVEGADQIKLPEVTNFSVFVDGIELKRPQSFPEPKRLGYPSPNPKVYSVEFNEVIAGWRLRLSGYIYTEQPHISPEEFKGVHIRIRNVGIGNYDKTWLGYPFDEGPKFGQVTGEIFVEEGLEQALNIDRDSFRETDTHYQALRAFLWEKLRTRVFPEFKLRQDQFRKERKYTENTRQETKFNEYVSQLPAPVLGKIQVEKGIEPATSHAMHPLPEPGGVTHSPKKNTPLQVSWIELEGSVLKLDKAYWDKFTQEIGLTEEAARKRFLNVLTVLVSSELLTDTFKDDIENLLRAIAVAVQ